VFFTFLKKFLTIRTENVSCMGGGGGGTLSHVSVLSFIVQKWFLKKYSIKEALILKKLLLMVRTQSLFNNLCFAWLNVPPPPHATQYN